MTFFIYATDTFFHIQCNNYNNNILFLFLFVLFISKGGGGFQFQFSLISYSSTIFY
jgi:hypothetical protein